MDARRIASQVRDGTRVAPEEIVAAFASLEHEPWSKELWATMRTLRHGMFAADSHVAVEHVVLDALPLQLRGSATIGGILLDEGDPLARPFPDNPWGIRPRDSLVEAIDHVWDVFDAPALVNALLERVQALVLLEQGGAPLLGYLHMKDRDSYEVPADQANAPRPPHDRRHAVAWEPFGDLMMFAGRAPAFTPTSKYGHAIPEPLRVLYRRHAGLFDGTWGLCGPDGLLPWNQMLEHTTRQHVRADDRDEAIYSDELLALFGYGDDRTDLLDIRDPDEPLVRSWGDGRLYAGGGTPIPEWLEGQTSLIAGIATD